MKKPVAFSILFFVLFLIIPDASYGQDEQTDSAKKYDSAYKEAYSRAKDEAESCLVLTKSALQCNYCEAYILKNRAEKSIREERNYSEKYGVTNLSKIDHYKQKIISYDKSMKRISKEYFTATKRAISSSRCKEEIDCTSYIDSLQNAIIDSLSNFYMEN